jgi:uncharacterized lipoprotein YddW (UPF0748 family)
MSDRQLIPLAVFLNGSGKNLQNKQEVHNRISSLVRDNKVRELYIPIVTSDGRSGIDVDTGRDSRFPTETRNRSLPFLGELWGVMGKETINRDLIAETRRIVERAGQRVGKGKDDVKIIAWVEGPFTVHPGHKALYNGLQDAVLREVLSSGDFGNQIKGEAGLVFLDPLDPKVQANLRNTILAAANKNGVTAILIDDHFGINLDLNKPETAKVRNAILQRHLNDIPDSYFNRTNKDDPTKPVPRTLGRLDPEKANQWIREQITRQVSDIKRSLPPGVELWASTNRPSDAQRNQLQDVKTWIDRGYIDRLNIQFYRPLADFNNQWNGLQQELAAIPRIHSRQVPVSVALAGEANQQDLPAQDMKAQVERVQNPNNPVPTYAVAFDDIRWSKKQQQLQQQLKSQVTPEQVQSVITAAYQLVERNYGGDIKDYNFLQSPQYELELSHQKGNQQQLRIYDKQMREVILSYQNSPKDFTNLDQGKLLLGNLMPHNVQDFQTIQQGLDNRAKIEEIASIAKRILYRYGEQAELYNLQSYHYEDKNYRIVQSDQGIQITNQRDGQLLFFFPSGLSHKVSVDNAKDYLTPQATRDLKAIGTQMDQEDAQKKQLERQIALQTTPKVDIGR